MNDMPRVNSLWDRETEHASGAGRGVDPNTPARALDDPFAHGQTDSSSGVLFAGVQSLENGKDPLVVLGVDSNPVITNFE